MKSLRFSFRLLVNKYTLTAAVALAWMTFFDGYNLLGQWERRTRLTELQHDKQWYAQEIDRLLMEEDELHTDPSAVERLAREKFLMRRPNEDVFVLSAQ
jgi:cell division protein FtsL